MLKTIKSFFDTKIQSSTQANTEDAQLSQLNLATAALMIEVMNADHQLDAREREEFTRVLTSSFDIDPEDIDTLFKLAEKEVSDATSLYEFTKLINEHYGYQERVKVIENMWRIAFSDDEIDKYEDSLIRKVADLLYLRHSDFIKAKLSVKNAKN